MSFIGKIYANFTKPELSKLAKESIERLEKCREELVFRSKTMDELLCDKFEYKGSKPNIIYLKNLVTGEPVESKVVLKRENKGDFFEEIITLLDEFGNEIGKKKYGCNKEKDGKYRMIYGEMDNFTKNIGGVGFRLDQMHIERALQLGVTSIPRLSEPRAIVYHTKMGFLPAENRLDKIKSINQLKNFTEEDFRDSAKSIPLSHFKPVIVQKGAKFYIDINKTHALTNISECIEIMKKNDSYRVLYFDATQTRLVLQGKELDHWKDVIKEHPILAKLK